MSKVAGLAKKSVRVIKALVASYVVTGVLLLVLTLVLYKFKISSTQIYIGVVITYIISCLVGGFIIGKIAKEKKFLWGVILGVSYFVILSLVSFIATQSFYDSSINAVIAFVSSAVGGMVGGMIS